MFARRTLGKKETAHSVRIASKEMLCDVCSGLGDVCCAINWPAMFIKTVFYSSFGFHNVLFVATIALLHVNDVIGVALKL